ncbi:TPA: DUF4406 domain-containing protein [Escherichia coli]
MRVRVYIAGPMTGYENFNREAFHRAEDALARKAVQAFCDVVGDSTEVICEEIGRDGVLVILEAMKATGNMPATDAFLSEVRAQGVEIMREHPSIKLCSLTHICDELAAQLRKGGNQ